MFQYKMSPVGRLFHESDKPVKMVGGPFGSGKTSMCIVDILANACAQYAAPDGVRYVRVGVIRSTYRELISTVRKSLLEVLPAECGTINNSGAPIMGFYQIPLPDGTVVHLELMMLAVGSAAETEKLRSLNFTFAWINEATTCAPEVFQVVQSRVGRYPSQDLGGIRWGGILMDFNQPAPGSWVDKFIKSPLPNWGVFLQPPAAFKRYDEHGKPYYEVNPNAENLCNLGAKEEGDPDDFTPEQRGMRYYRGQIDSLLAMGRTDVVDNQYCMLDIPLVDGKPVYTNFNHDRHIAPVELVPELYGNIIVGLDQSGIHPAGVILQMQQGKWCVLDELYAEGEGFENFLHGMLIPLLTEKYPTNPVIAAIDPSNQRDSWTAVTPRQRLEDAGIVAVSELTNTPKLRIQNVEHMLNMETGGILVSPTCRLLIRGFESEYKYRRMRAAGTLGSDVYTPTPEKNDSSHVHDALQYAVLLIQRDQRVSDSNVEDISYRLSERRRVMGRLL